MSGDFFELEGTVPVQDANDLTIPRAKALFNAVARHADYEVLALHRRQNNDGSTIEYLIVDVACHGVPSKHSRGISFRERLALCVVSHLQRVPWVRALRKDFPLLPHQNAVGPGEPAHLCLYMEPDDNVLQTWTPERFLGRIQWWMTKSSRGELHAADQPLEQLFFTSTCQLILPWNYEQLREKKTSFFLTSDGTRPDGGMTVFLVPAGSVQVKRGVLLNINLAPVVSDRTTSTPTTLGQLIESFSEHGIDVMPLLRAEVRKLVDSQGVHIQADTTYTLLLINVPLCRSEHTEPERIERLAFLVTAGGMAFGASIDALIEHDGRYFTSEGVLQAPANEAWRNVGIFPVEVLSENSAEDSRFQSGLISVGPKGVLIGAGALGSSLLDLWARSGWGDWTVVDNDYIRPHNLSRHRAMAAHIGRMKVQAVEDLHMSITHGASVITPLIADAQALHNDALQVALNSAEIVVDATASLGYPRHASDQDRYARHVSLFATPTANAGVMLLEDKARTSRLRTLEAQYYRALLNHEWGNSHLVSAMPFWSGRSCRDISTVMPYARILKHASVFADQLPAYVSQPDAAIVVWQDDENGKGGLTYHAYDVEQEMELGVDGLRVYMDAGLKRKLRALRDQGLPNETGGVLLGYFDLPRQMLILVDALPAPPDSCATQSSFSRGIEGLKDTIAQVEQRAAGTVGYVGEWHSHPKHCSAKPSDDDGIQLSSVAMTMVEEGLPGIQLIVGETDFYISIGTLVT